MQALVFANGDINDGAMVRRILSRVQTPLVIAADGGARVALYFNFLPDIVVGDMDSLSAAEVESLRVRGVDIRRHPAEKDETDLELALKLAAARGATWISIIGGIGDRIDQTIANLYLMSLPELEGREVVVAAGRQEIRLLHPGDTVICGAPGDTLSLIPLGGAVHGVRTQALYYPLNDETLEFGPARGISNIMTSDCATISLGDGRLLLIHTEGRA